LALPQQASRWAVRMVIFSAGVTGWQPQAADSLQTERRAVC